MKRENGFYWVMYDGEWTIADYYETKDGMDHGWFCTGLDDIFKEEEFEQINETRIIPPNEQTKAPNTLTIDCLKEIWEIMPEHDHTALNENT